MVKFENIETLTRKEYYDLFDRIINYSSRETVWEKWALTKERHYIGRTYSFYWDKEDGGSLYIMLLEKYERREPTLFYRDEISASERRIDSFSCCWDCARVLDSIIERVNKEHIEKTKNIFFVDPLREEMPYFYCGIEPRQSIQKLLEGKYNIKRIKREK